MTVTSPEQAARLAESIKKSNFHIGETSQFFRETSHSHSYALKLPPDYQGSTLNQEVKNDLRRAHFQFGTEPSTNYLSTAKQTFVNQGDLAAKGVQGLASKKEQEKERMAKMRTQHFSYGQDVPQYQSMAKKDFKTHDVLSAHKNLQLQKANGRELRKSHFLFGCDTLTFQMESAGKVGVSQSAQQLPERVSAQGSSAQLRKNNFEVGQAGQGGSDFFTYETVTGQQLACAATGRGVLQANQKEQAAQMDSLKQDLRAAHFHLGNDKPGY